MSSWYGNVPSFSWQCGNVIISCVSRVLNQVFQYLRRPLLKHQSYQLRDIVQRNFRPACSTHLERSVAWKQLSGDVLVQEFRVLVVTGCEGMASRGSSNRRRDLKKKKYIHGMAPDTGRTALKPRWDDSSLRKAEIDSALGLIDTTEEDEDGEEEIQ